MKKYILVKDTPKGIKYFSYGGNTYNANLANVFLETEIDIIKNINKKFKGKLILLAFCKFENPRS